MYLLKFLEATRGMIIGMHQAGSNIAEIANEIGCSRNTVRLWINRHARGGHNALSDHRKYNPPPRRTSAAQDEVINEFFTDHDPFSSTARFTNVVNAEICNDTIRRRLNEMGIHSRRPAFKFALTDAHRAQRIAYAEQYGQEPEEFWMNTICVDEKSFSTSKDGRIRVWRSEESRLRENCVVATQHSGRISCNFWGCCSIYGVGVLRQVGPRFNSEAYVELLENDFLPYVDRIFPANEYEEVKIIQDNHPIHRSQLTMEWFERHPRLFLLPHPPYSPDLNPIENLWAKVVRDWRSGADRNLAALIDHALRSWEDTGDRPEVVSNMILSMPRRLQAVIDNQGFWTKY